MTVWGIFSLFFFCLFYNERQLSLQILLCEKKKIFLFSLACCIAETQFVHFKLLATFFAHLLFFETFCYDAADARGALLTFFITLFLRLFIPIHLEK
jgi:hypothetical protein